MSNNDDIKYYNRSLNKIEAEKVYGDAFIKLLYGTSIGRGISPLIASKKISQAYGFLQDSYVSKVKVPKFIKNFNINMDEYERGSLDNTDKNNSYKNFNEFFIRKISPGIREFSADKNHLGAFAEARYFAWDKISDELTIPVKGKWLKPSKILNNTKYNNIFENGPLMIARLCPVDYHRYHYPDNGTNIESYQIHGEFHSVNPLALKARGDIFIANERRVSILKTENFGKIAYIEVGATCVGKIVQSHDESVQFKKGDEKGYFLFGGSTVIIIGEEGRFRPSSDILENTKNGIETYIKLGDTVGSTSI